MKRFLFIFLFLILFINACAKQQTQEQQVIQKTVQTVSAEDVSTLTPEQVVILYFQAWNDEQYDVMYSLLSNGFKQIEPTAKIFADFKANMEKFYDTALGVRIVEAKESYRTEKEAGVDYKIEITRKDGTKKDFSSVYTLKKRESNASELTRSQVTGWKLIHPYGENIDTT
ncbi:MAG: hypothetical protein Q8R04_00530 [Nanoarchaeota archaeon]|nr:hypothetical protein [Nanoarchaeota archaeon]